MREWTAAALWARRHARQRWRSLLLLGVLAGLTSSFAMAAAAGARRTDTALTRLESVTRSADAIVFTSQVQVFHPQWRKLEHQPEVLALAPWDLLFGFVSGQPGGVLFASDDGRWGSLVDRPIVLEGRMYNPKADNEMVIDQQVAASEDLHVGDVVPFHAYSPDQPQTEGQPAGPSIKLKVVGIVRDTDEFLFTPGPIVSPGVVAHYRDRMLVAPNAMVRIRPAHGGVGALRTDVDRLIAPNVPVLDLQSAGRRVTTTLSVENFALWVLALAIALAGGLLVAQMLSRSVSLIGEDTRPLRALGFTRADVSVGSLLAHGSVFVVTIAVALLGAIALSPLFPIGLGRQIDPDPGVHADWTVLGAGLVLTLVLLIGSTVLMTVSTLSREARHAVGRRSAVTAWLRRTAPLPVSLGVTAAFERAPGARGTPVRPALVGAIVGVLGVISALTVDHGIHHALANPQLAGVTWAVSVAPPPQDVTSTGVSRALLVQLAHAVPDGSTAVVRRDLVDVDGVGVPAFSIVDHSDRAGAISLVTVSGRIPKADDEAAIGPATAKQIDVRVGDWVRIANGARVRVVGEALFPSDVHAEFDEGLWLLPKEFDTVVPPSTPANSDEAVALRFSNDGDQESSALHAAEVVQETGSMPPTPVLDRLITELGGPTSLLYQNTEPAGVPLELVNLDDVAEIPLLLSVFLALLALAALSFVLVASGRARQEEFAVLRALGLGTSASRSIVYWQATSIAVVGLVIGVPLGIVVGRWGWGEVTARVPLVYLAPTALLVVGLAIPGAVFLANFVAILPAHRVSSLRAAEALRTE
jgi:ABC-type lipoprotein release transport system permease subunit